MKKIGSNRLNCRKLFHPNFRRMDCKQTFLIHVDFLWFDSQNDCASFKKSLISIGINAIPAIHCETIESKPILFEWNDLYGFKPLKIYTNWTIHLSKRIECIVDVESKVIHESSAYFASLFLMDLHSAPFISDVDYALSVWIHYNQFDNKIL